MRLVVDSTWKDTVLILKGVGYYRGIGLVDFVWKVVTVILNLLFTEFIALYDVLHGLRAGYGTGTAYLKARLIQQLASMGEEVLHEIFLDLHKAYKTFYRDILLEILEGYSVGPQYRCIFWEY